MAVSAVLVSDLTGQQAGLFFTCDAAPEVRLARTAILFSIFDLFEHKQVIFMFAPSAYYLFQRGKPPQTL